MGDGTTLVSLLFLRPGPHFCSPPGRLLRVRKSPVRTQVRWTLSKTAINCTVPVSVDPPFETSDTSVLP